MTLGPENPRPALPAERRAWECLAQEWVTVLHRHYADDTYTVQYANGRQLRVGEWILTDEEQP